MGSWLHRVIALVALCLGLGVAASPAQAAWSGQTSALTAVIIGSTSCPTANDCVQVNNAGRFQYTLNAGATWTASSADLTDSTWGMDCPTASTCFTTSDNGSIYRSTDHGATWTPSFTGSPALYAIDCPTAQICYAGTTDGRVRKTVDGGANWTINTAGSAAGIYSISCPSTTVCFSITAAGEIRRKQAASDTWDLVASSALIADVLTPYTHGIACPSLTTCYVAGTSGVIHKTSDGGATWPTQTTAAAPDLYAISCFSEARCMAVGVANHSLFTDDGGATWDDENTGSAAAMYSVDFAGGTRAIAGDAIGKPYAYGAPAVVDPPGTATAEVNAGSLTFTNSTPGNVVFPALTLDGTDRVRFQTQPIDVADATGSGNGWSITATSTLFTSGSDVIPAGSAVIPTEPAPTCVPGSTCVLANNAVPFPYALPAGATAPPATKLFSAGGSTGMGVQRIVPNWRLTVPGNTRAGTYTSTWTFTLVSGP